MKSLVFALIFCVFFAAGPSAFAKGIDLMDLKKKEEERRKNLAKSKLAVNDTNVDKITIAGKRYAFVQMETEGQSGEGEVAAESGVPVAEDKSDVTKQPDFWKTQKNDLEQRIAQLKEEIDSGQSQLNKLWTDFYIKNIATEQNAIKVQIAQLTNQIEQKKVFVSESERQLEELYEKARKAGVPPGWLR
jgi:chromosome segregation ATPase